ncbi:PLA2G4F isoform 3 [Pongo abelii]|uniref:phospholipase A2 n=1 Tax=Pongo abelii TaxID=9601 RepID=A0A2J8S5N5_PONAB|nr:PLA2G4F isoform 3 [Pongo abelii]
MLWALWPRWLAGKMLPLLGAVLLQKREKKGPLWRHWRRETYPYYDLQVKVLRATNIRGTDLLSKADCYVQLWLPTASPSPAQTRIVANCSDPEWNETFHYQIHGAVKNVLELTLYDKDILGSDQLSLLLFDLRSLKCGQPHRHTFPLNHQDSQELQVEFVLEKSQVPASEVITNGVLVAHPCLRIQGTLQGDGTAPREEYACHRARPSTHLYLPREPSAELQATRRADGAAGGCAEWPQCRAGGSDQQAGRGGHPALLSAPRPGGTVFCGPGGGPGGGSEYEGGNELRGPRPTPWL